MAESQTHIELVQELYYWVKSEIFNGDDGSIFVALPKSTALNKPPRVIDNFEPDLYAKEHKMDLLVIGEAKTPQDISSHHSILQYKAYLQTCLLHKGFSYIVFAVPSFWKTQMTIVINKHLQPKKYPNIKIKILEFNK